MGATTLTGWIYPKKEPRSRNQQTRRRIRNNLHSRSSEAASARIRGSPSAQAVESEQQGRGQCLLLNPLMFEETSSLQPDSNRCTPKQFVRKINDVERASYNGSIEASQASDVGSIPIARSRF